jgi:hypothetical protein
MAESRNETYGVNGNDVTFISPVKPGIKITITGGLEQNSIAKSGSILFQYIITENGFIDAQALTFDSVIGDNTFRLTEARSITDTPPRVLDIEFNSNKTYQLPFIPQYTGCKVDTYDNQMSSLINLKMMKIVGNRLEYQIILPECIKKLL